MSGEAREDSFAIDGASGMRWVTSTVRPGAWYTTGIVVTEHGIVSVYTQVDNRSANDCSSRYDFAWKGRHYIRYDPLHRTERGLTIEAAKFARRIAAADPGVSS